MDLKARLAAVGITSRALAARLGVRRATISDALRGAIVPAGYIVAAIEALEVMTPEQRALWLRLDG